jgi:hypothetical protein
MLQIKINKILLIIPQIFSPVRPRSEELENISDPVARE